MLKNINKTLVNIFRIFDIIIIIVSFYISHFLRFGYHEYNLININQEFTIFFVSYVIIWLFFSHRFSLYVSKRHTSFKNELFNVLKSVGLTFAFAEIPAFFIRDLPLSRLFLIYFIPIQTSLLILFRFLLRLALKNIRRRGYNYRQILIAGRNRRAAKIAQKIRETPEYGLRILGFIDENQNGSSTEDFGEFNLLGDLDELENIVKNQVVDEVFITLPMKSFYPQIEKILKFCEQGGIETEISADIFKVDSSKTNIQKYDDIKFINFYTSPEMNLKLVMKRLIDIIFSFVSLVVIAPVFLILGIIIKMTSKGPIFFIQKRIGYNGRFFNFLKFRTMVEDAEELKISLHDKNEMEGPVFKIKSDPRITKTGKFLRKYSMDELPQLINVLMGEMSLIGPRPPTPEEVIKYKLSDRRRLSMKPGITCLWQVNGRNNVSFEKWVELDKQYIDNWSPWLDFNILLKTIPAVLRGTGI